MAPDVLKLLPFLVAAALVACDDNTRADRDSGPEADLGTGGICPRTGLPIGPEVCDEIDNDCDARIDEGFDLTDDVNHCGACGNRCEAENTQAACVDGACAFRCEPGFYATDGRPENGCTGTCSDAPEAEVCDGADNDCDGRTDEDFDLLSDLTHCGECGNTCSYRNADAQCDGGVCRLTHCQPGWGDLNRDPSDGCEAPCDTSNDGVEICDGADNDCDGVIDEGFDLQSDGEHCGECGNRCDFANGAGRCDRGDCVLAGCEAGFTDEDGDPSNGCEQVCRVTNDGVEICDDLDNDCNGVVDDGVDKLTDVENCGGCGAQDERFICRLPNAEVACMAGTCGIDSCVPGFSDADGNPANGCEQPCFPTNGGVEVCDRLDNDCNGRTDEGFDLRNDVQNCGECGTVCQTGNAVPACNDGTCAVGACPPGFVDSDRNPRNGCEYECTPTPDPTEICDTLDNDCDGRIDEGFDIFNDLDNCGACGDVCDPQNAIALCNNGVCDIGGCDEGWFDADGDLTNGCEIECTPSDDGFEICDGEDNDCDGTPDEDFDLETDPLNCGECNNACRFPNGRVSCQAAACQPAGCLEGWVDANGDPADGCEYRCTPTADPAEVCDGRDNDCNGVVDDGFDLANSLQHCGACNSPCARPNAVAVCDAGLCTIGECQPGFVDINGDPTDGCEAACVPSDDRVERCNQRDDDCDGRVDEDTDLNNDPQNCGACGRTCEVPNGQPFCNGGSCDVLSCNQGFVDLDRDPVNGCECRTSNGGLEICDGLDNDCNGIIDDPDRVVPPADFRCLSQGVCRGTRATCQGAQWRCPYPATYEVEETRCDGLDNDCDGERDEPFPDLGRPCSAGIGVCREVGTVECNGLAATACTAQARPERAQPETCNGEDDDCDGETDEDSDALVLVPAGNGVPAFSIYAYEASRTDAEGGSPGQSFARACSKPDVLPWVNVDYATALRACQDAGLTLCNRDQWARACGGNNRQAYPYGANYQANTCNGQDYDTDAMTPGNQDEALPAGALDQCVRTFNGLGIYDLSGNVWEWTSHDVTGDGTARGLRGGSFGNIAGGLTCDFVLANPPATARENIGFRCCTP